MSMASDHFEAGWLVNFFIDIFHLGTSLLPPLTAHLREFEEEGRVLRSYRQSVLSFQPVYGNPRQIRARCAQRVFPGPWVTGSLLTRWRVRSLRAVRNLAHT